MWATRRALGIALKHPFHMRQLCFERLVMFDKMTQGNFITSLPTKEELGKKLVFGKALWRGFLQPYFKLDLALRRQPIELAVRSMLLNDDFRFNQPLMLQRLERRINLAIARVPVAGNSAIKGLLNIVTGHGPGAQQTKDNRAQGVARVRRLFMIRIFSSQAATRHEAIRFLVGQ